MTDLSRVLIATAISVLITAAVVMLGRKPQKQFAFGCGMLFSIAFGISVVYPVTLYSGGSFWGEGYSTAFPAVSALYAIAQIAIWRGFTKPGWLSFCATLPFAIVLACMGFWEWIA